jgi:hypothetical protein
MEHLAGFAVAGQPGLLLREAARQLAVPGTLLPQVAHGLDIGERQLRRRAARSVGYGPQMLGTVNRLQRMLTRHEHAPNMPLAEHGLHLPTGVSAPALLEGPVQDDSRGYDHSVILLIHRFPALLSPLGRYRRDAVSGFAD